MSAIAAGFEARGLIFGAPLALALDCAFVPLRKPGKLPGETIQESYDLEYGSDKIEMHVGHIQEGQRVLLLDDLIATGGTMGAGIKLMRMPHHSSMFHAVYELKAGHCRHCRLNWMLFQTMCANTELPVTNSCRNPARVRCNTFSQRTVAFGATCTGASVT